MNKIYNAIILLSLLACAPNYNSQDIDPEDPEPSLDIDKLTCNQNKLEYILDPSFSSIEKEQFIVAWSSWYYVVSPYVDITISMPKDIDTSTYNACAVKVIKHEGPKETIAWTWSITNSNGKTQSSRIWVPGGYPPDISRMMFAHEIGHSLGLRHSTNPDTLMFAFPDVSWVTKEDAFRAVSIWKN